MTGDVLLLFHTVPWVGLRRVCLRYFLIILTIFYDSRDPCKISLIVNVVGMLILFLKYSNVLDLNVAYFMNAVFAVAIVCCCCFLGGVAVFISSVNMRVVSLRCKKSIVIFHSRYIFFSIASLYYLHCKIIFTPNLVVAAEQQLFAL